MTYQDRAIRDPLAYAGAGSQVDVRQDDADGIASFISEASIGGTPFIPETAPHVLSEFPEEAFLPAPSIAATRRIHTPVIALMAAAFVAATIAGIWWTDVAPWTRAVDTGSRAEAPARPNPAPVASQPPAVPQPLASVAVQPLRDQPIASAINPTLPPDEILRASTIPKPVALSVASARPPAAPDRPASALRGTSGGETPRPFMSRPPAEPVQMSSAIAANTASRVAPPESAPALEAPPLAAPQPSRPEPLTTSNPPEAFAAVAARTEQNGIQQVLGRYRSAYERLDADAAQAVWPSVDARALARAFDSLASQELAFDNCEVNVAGETATAQCRGSARFKAKIGGREARLESREWVFQLRKAADGWKIQTAQTKR
jgi:hypothetical protein